MAKKLISFRLDDSLSDRLDILKDRFNISDICRKALVAKIEAEERIATALANPDEIKGLLDRLRLQKVEANSRDYELGRTLGYGWSLREATYAQISRYGRRGLLYREPKTHPEADEAVHYDNYPNPMVPDTFPAGSADRLLMDARETAEEEGETFEQSAFELGFVESIRSVWAQIEGEVQAELGAEWQPPRTDNLGGSTQ